MDSKVDLSIVNKLILLEIMSTELYWVLKIAMQWKTYTGVCSKQERIKQPKFL